MNTKPGDIVRKCIHGRLARLSESLWVVDYVTPEGLIAVTIKPDGSKRFAWRDVFSSWVVVQRTERSTIEMFRAGGFAQAPILAAGDMIMDS